MKFFDELKRRNVFRVSIAYAVVSWVLLQVVDLVLENISAPDWVMKVFMLGIAVGFPIAIIIAWAFELTPEGIKRESEIDRSQSIVQTTGRKLDRVIIGFLVLAVIFLLVDPFDRQAAVEPAVEITSEAASDVIVPGSTSADQTEATENTGATRNEHSVAVLPFVNMSSDPEQEYFSDGISEEILNVLTRIPDLKVAARTSSFQFKGKNLDIAEVGKQLRVNHVLEGSVRKSGTTLRITTQLIETETGYHLWSETFDRKLEDVFAIQDEIANAIVAALRGSLAEAKSKEQVKVKADTSNMQAYDMYLKARELFIARSDLKESVELFERVVEMDPNFARGWEGLAAVTAVVESWGIIDRDYNGMVVPAAERALKLDPALSMPWAALAMAEQNEQNVDWARSLELSDKAIKADPKNATAYLWRSIAWLNLGFFEKALADQDSCLRVDPAYKNCTRWKAQTYIYTGDDAKAMD